MASYKLIYIFDASAVAKRFISACRAMGYATCNNGVYHPSSTVYEFILHNTREIEILNKANALYPSSSTAVTIVKA